MVAESFYWKLIVSKRVPLKRLSVSVDEGLVLLLPHNL